MDTSFFSCASLLVGNRNLSMTLMATSRFVLRCIPMKKMDNLSMI